MNYEKISKILTENHHWREVTFQDYTKDYGLIVAWINVRFSGGKVEFYFKQDANAGNYWEVKGILLCTDTFNSGIADYDLLAVSIDEKALNIQKSIQTEL